jgi:hypothetical protein
MTSHAELADNFPQPLSSAQRRRFELHTLGHMRQRKALGQQLALAERHLQALEESSRRIAAKTEDLIKESTAAHSDGAERGTSGFLPTKRPRQDDPSPSETHVTSADVQNSATTQVVPPARRGGLRRSAAFGALQTFLSAAIKDSADQLEVTRRREAIARDAQLAQLRVDAADVESKLRDAHAAVAAMRASWSMVDAQWQQASALLERLDEAETSYCSSFFLRAAGDDYDVFFCPAVHTEETRDLVSAQVELALDEYLPFRTEIDPVLMELDEAALAAEAADATAPGLNNAAGILGDVRGIQSFSSCGLLPPPPQGPEPPLLSKPESMEEAVVNAVLAAEQAPRPYTELDDFED